jgi:hypothetical protein
MASRFTVDTNILRIRDVYALNLSNAEFIRPLQFPSIGENGRLKWYSTLELLSSMSIPALSCSVLTILSTVQPGISTMSSITASTQASYLNSTVTGLGSVDYVSTSFLFNQIVLLSQVHKYVSCTTLYDCFAHLADMRWIGDNAGPMSLIGSNFSGGYVSTMNPGQFTILRSTLGIQGGNVNNTLMDNTSNITSINIDIGGYSNKIANSSKLQIDIDLNAYYGFTGGVGGICYLSTYLTSVGGLQQIGKDCVTSEIPAGVTSTNQGHIRFLLRKQDLTPWPGALQLHHTLSNTVGTTTRFGCYVPKTSGIFVTLDNID